MRPELHHATDELGREAHEPVRPSLRASPPIGRPRREHPGESVEVKAFVVRPTARIDHALEVRPVRLHQVFDAIEQTSRRRRGVCAVVVGALGIVAVSACIGARLWTRC